MPKRTTITLDDDVVSRLNAEMRKTGRGLKQLVNENLRRGFDRQQTGKMPPFRVKAKDLGSYPGLNYKDVEELLDYGEGPYRR
jgi:hypothetical protein